MVCGPGALRELATIARRTGMTAPLIVTDPGIRSFGILDRTVDALRKMGERAQVFDGVSTRCTESDVRSGLDVYHASAADGIVAVGGGSAVDAAKAIRLLTTHDGPVASYDIMARGTGKISDALPPLIAIPTTAGTGSEVSSAAMITTIDDSGSKKTLVHSPKLVPDWSLLDPELTVSQPSGVTAGSGMDTLSHFIEEFVSPRYHPAVSALAHRGMHRIARDLPTVWNKPEHLEARGEMLMSAMLGGSGFVKGLGAVHAMAHGIGALHDVHHGRLCATLLPHAMEFNAEHLAPGCAVELAQTIGRQDTTAAEALAAFVDWLMGLNVSLQIEPRLRDLGVGAEMRDRAIALALGDHCLRTNPRPCEQADLLELWERAW